MKELLKKAILIGSLVASITTLSHAQPDPLPSWHEGVAKKAIVNFVTKVTKKGGSDFVPIPERIAVFDNDGTLWSEQPVYFQLAFALDRIKALAPQHPEWKEKQPFKAVIEGDTTAALASGEHGIVEMTTATHAGITTEEFEKAVKDWIASARHPRFKRPYTDLVFQPMLELLAFLRASGFKTYIVSGGGVDFMRAWTEHVYGIPSEQVIGSSGKLKYEIENGKPELVKLPEADFVDDKEGKPIGIQKFIGRRPIAAFGNSDGDLEMLQWTTTGKGLRLGVLIHHTDAEREWAYDKGSPIGALDKALDEASKRGWIVVDMKESWKMIYAFQK